MRKGNKSTGFENTLERTMSMHLEGGSAYLTEKAAILKVLRTTFHSHIIIPEFADTFPYYLFFLKLGGL